MLETLWSWVLFTVVTYLVGLASVRLFCIATKRVPTSASFINWPLLQLIGLSSLIIILQILSIAYAIDWKVQTGLLIAGLFYILCDLRFIGSQLQVSWKAFVQAPAWIRLVLATLFLVVAFQSSIGPDHPDAGVYHVQAIRWIQTYSVIPGLGNLHGRFAFNPSWFLPNALVTFYDEFGQDTSIHSLNGWLLVMVIWYFVSLAQKAWRTQIVSAVTVGATLLLLILPWINVFHTYELSSPSLELPSMLFLFIIALLWLQRPNSSQPEYSLWAVVITLFLAVAMTLKVLLFPVALLLPVIWYSLFRLQKQWSVGLSTISIVGLTLIPWIIRNVIISGYLLYPFGTINLFNLDWRIPADTVTWMQDLIRGWAIEPGPDAIAVASRPFIDWFPTWFSHFQQNPLIRHVFGPLWLIGVASLLWLRRRLRSYWMLAWVLPGVSIVGLAIWFFGAPDFSRFALGYTTLFTLVLCIPVVLHLWQRHGQKRWWQALVVGSLVMVMFYTIKTKVRYEVINVTTLTQITPYPASTPLYDESRGFPLWISDFCWNTQLPCTAQPDISHLQMRGDTLADGFRDDRLAPVNE